MNSKNIVYALIDPTTQEIRYIGKTEQGVSRLLEHLKPSSLKNNTHKDNWIKRLLKQDLTPEFYVLEEFDNPNDLFEAEEFWYEYYKGIGSNLTNLTVCGKGTRGYKHKEETLTKLKISAANRDQTPYEIPHNKKFNKLINGEEFRNCPKCLKDKLTEQFTWAKSRDQYQAYCKQCNGNYKKEWKKLNPSLILNPQEYNQTRLPGAKAGGEASKRPERRTQTAQQRSKAIQGIHIDTGETITFGSALKAKESGFQNSNIGQAIKFNKPYKGYKWSFIKDTK